MIQVSFTKNEPQLWVHRKVMSKNPDAFAFGIYGAVDQFGGQVNLEKRLRS